MKSIDEKIKSVLFESAELAAEIFGEPAVMRQIGSPIEKLMLAALWSRGVWRARMVFEPHMNGRATVEMLRDQMRRSILDDASTIYSCSLIQQMMVGPYVADFGIVAATSDSRVLVVAVECDGHDFHERTKQQVARDKARDRAFAERDIRLFRFSGSEIWRDAGLCADQVLEFVWDWRGQPFFEFLEREWEKRARDQKEAAE